MLTNQFIIFQNLSLQYRSGYNFTGVNYQLWFAHHFLATWKNLWRNKNPFVGDSRTWELGDFKFAVDELLTDLIYLVGLDEWT